jgi:UDP-N-acetylmuramoyl-tripeptide--D-alanyl-D-alanine ligase
MLIVLSISVIAAASIMFFSRRLLCYLRHFQDNKYSSRLFKDWLVANGIYDRKGSMVATLVALILEVTKMQELPAFILCLISAAVMVWLSLQEVDPRKAGHPLLRPTKQARGIYHLALSLYSITLVCLVVILHGHNADDEDLAAYWLIVIVAIQSSPIWLIFANRLLTLAK